MIASETLRLADVEVDFADWAGSSPWRDSAVMTLSAVTFLEAVFEAGNSVFDF
jgi:hypothetical protein